MDFSRNDVLTRFCMDVSKYGLSIFVGSGVNGSACSQWGALTSDMLDAALLEMVWTASELSDTDRRKNLVRWSRSFYDNYGMASLVKALAPQRYRELLRHQIYSSGVHDRLKAYCRKPDDADEKGHNDFALLRTVAELSLLEKVLAVVTFNYDDLLDRAIAVLRGTEEELEDRKIKPLIVRPHGHLASPHSLVKGEDRDVVLSHDEYFQRSSESFQVSTPLHYLRNTCVLFVGSSLKDWDMLQMLKSAYPEHQQFGTYCLLSEEDMNAEGCGLENDHELSMRLHASLLDAFGVRILPGGQFRKEIPIVLRNIISTLKDHSERKEEGGCE